MSRKPTRGIEREWTDYTNLLTELQSKKTKRPKSKKGAKEKAPALPQISPARQRLMSDEHVWYLYEKGGGVIHDKTCLEARWIPDETLRCTEKYLQGLRPCAFCQTKAYLRLGAKDLYNLRGYETVFAQMRISPQLQRRAYVHEGIRTEYLGPGRLKLWGKEDTWLLETIPGSTHLRLLHNNYCPQKDGTRRFVPGFHEQAICTSAKYAFSVIIGYTYAGHIAAMERQQAAASAPVEEDKLIPQVPPRPQSIWKRFLLWLKRLSKR